MSPPPLLEDDDAYRAHRAHELTLCDVCACPAELRSYFDEDGRRLRYCSFHEDHGTDLPCPDCALLD
jgi:hypothetical protein